MNERKQRVDGGGRRGPTGPDGSEQQTTKERKRNMKLNGKKNSKLGIAMTEYLIILAVVAIACVLAAGQFGSQIKNVFAAAGTALTGKAATVTPVTVDVETDGLDKAFTKTTGK